jgi:hypothetical protein
VPEKLLELKGNLPGMGMINIKNTSSTGYSSIDFFDENGTQMGNVGYANGAANLYGDALYFASNTAVDVVVSTNNVEGWRLKPSGFVGAGTSDPIDKFDVMNGNLVVTNDDNTARALRLYEPSSSGSNYTGFRAQAQSANITYTLPSSAGSSGQALTTDGSGNLSWSSVGGAATSTALNDNSQTLSSSTNNLDISGKSYVKLNNGSSSNFTITGIVAGTDGQIIVVQNSGSGNMTIRNSNNSSSASNRIITGSGSDFVTSGTGSVTMIYDGDQSRWVVISTVQ